MGGRLHKILKTADSLPQEKEYIFMKTLFTLNKISNHRYVIRKFMDYLKLSTLKLKERKKFLTYLTDPV